MIVCFFSLLRNEDRSAVVYKMQHYFELFGAILDNKRRSEFISVPFVFDLFFLPMFVQYDRNNE